MSHTRASTHIERCLLTLALCMLLRWSALLLLLHAAACSERTLHVVTVVTDPSHPNLLRSVAFAARRGVALRVLVEPRVFGHGVGFTAKLTRVVALLQTLPPDDVLLFTDGYDSLVAAPPAQLLRSYDGALEAYGAAPGTPLFSAERTCWPDAHLSASYPPHATHPDSPYRHLNSGGYMGRVRSLRELFNRAEVQQLPPSADDQRVLTQLYLQHSVDAPLVLDAGNLVFNAMALAEHDVERTPDGLWSNSVTHTQPLVLHGNGPAVFFLFGQLFAREMQEIDGELQALRAAQEERVTEAEDRHAL